MKTEMALFAVTRIETFKHDLRAKVTSHLKTATGFFYVNAMGETFLVTNRHVVYSKDEHYFPDRLRFYVHTDPFHYTKMKHVDLRLWGKEGEKLWRWVKHRPIDVAALRVPAGSMTGCFVTCFSKADLLDDHAGLLPGNDISLGLQALVIGYPLGFYDKNTHLPMARSATVATWPWLNFEGRPCFLVDARLHPGNSGSPVISSSGTIRMKQDSPDTEGGAGNTGSYLLGIISDERTPWDEPLGLNTVWHASLVEDLVSDD